MIKDYVFDILNGRLGVLRFGIMWIVLTILPIVSMIILFGGVRAAADVMDFSFNEIQEMLLRAFGVIPFVFLLLLSLLFAFVQLNIIAKRARDAGLPGWLTAVIIGCLFGGASQFANGEHAGGFGLLLILILALIPTDTFRRQTSPSAHV